MNENGLIPINQKPRLFYLTEGFIFLLAVLIVCLFVFQPTEIDGGSMLPGILHEDVAMLVSKKPKNGDIVVAQSPEIDPRTNQYKLVIKRVAGTGGDVLEFRSSGGYVDLYRGGSAVDEAYLLERMTLASFWSNWQVKPDEPFTVPEGEFFLLGDNRNVSKDSRLWGSFSADKIEGVAVAVYRKDSFITRLIRLVYFRQSSVDAPAGSAA